MVSEMVNTGPAISAPRVYEDTGANESADTDQCEVEGSQDCLQTMGWLGVRDQVVKILERPLPETPLGSRWTDILARRSSMT